MERGAKSAKSKAEAQPTAARRPRTVEASSGLQFKQRLAEALEQHAAISEILRVISSSSGDVTPVLASVAERAAHLCNASFAQVLLVEGNVLRPTVAYWADADSDQKYDDSRGVKRTWPLTRSMFIGRAVLDCETIHHADVLPLLDSEYPDSPRAKQQELGYRAVLAVPLMREGGASGVIFIFRREPRPFSPEQVALVQTFARQAAIAIENVHLFKETKEALEHQTAMSEILRVISQSPADVQPVFDTIAAAALQLCGAGTANVVTFDGELIHLVAFANLNPEVADGLRQLYPRPPGRDRATPRAILTRSIVAIPDVDKDPEYVIPSHEYEITARGRGFRSILSVPLMREASPIGAITVGRPQPGTFPQKQIALLQTFADQAVIAIENVRLFRELGSRNRALTEALEQQTATSDILRVISQSPTDVQPAFQTIATSALMLCSASVALVTTFDGELIRVASLAKLRPEGVDGIRDAFPMPPGRDTANSRAILTACVIQIPDVLEDPSYARTVQALAADFRSILAVPLMRDGKPLGAISVGRPEPGLFPDTQIALLKTFADQAVIAIENVRLFTELTHKNRELTQAHAQVSEALEHQTATSEILRVISSSPTDVQPVFEIIGERAAKLCDAQVSVVSRVEGDQIHLVALHGMSEEAKEISRRYFPMPLSFESSTSRAVRSRAVVHLADVLSDAQYGPKDAARAGGWRSCLAVPMLREGAVIGAIFVGRAASGHFPDSKVELLKTFADQAVIAIQNARLFAELDARTTQLTRSVGELKALGEVGQAVSSTLDLETVLRTIVSRATALAGMDGGAIFEYDETREEFRLHATDNLPDELVGALGAAPIKKDEGAIGRLAVTGEPVQIPDIVDERSYQSHVREILIRLGSRSLLAVPLLREHRLLGGLVVNRKSAGEFAPHVIDLLKTFATQSALAIQNARLFREIEEKSRELATASRHKSEFLANMSHELRTPLNAIIGFSEVLAERMFGEINEKQAEYLSDILESGRHLLSLINDILDLSKIEAGRMELERADFSLPHAIDNTLTLVRERAHRRGITLARTIDERLGMIHADERKVKQVLLNLLSNALKFTPERGRIDVRAEANGEEAEISVTDTGVGIAPEDQPAVFEEFRQVGAAANKVEGTGLGLAISRKFIELHEGKIWVRSEVGAGSTFTFTLPLAIDLRHQTES